jgi:hypothetical protein
LNDKTRYKKILNPEYDLAWKTENSCVLKTSDTSAGL